ncbi:MAG: ATP-binding protein, partial [Haloferacaceae archaeon]
MSKETDADDSPAGSAEEAPVADDGEPSRQPGRSPPDGDRSRGHDVDKGEPEGSIDDLGSDVEVSAEVDEEAEDDLLGGLLIDSTADIQVPDRLVDQVIGQEHARDVVMKAAKQRRHVMMIGSPGTGKSMLAK